MEMEADQILGLERFPSGRIGIVALEVGYDVEQIIADLHQLDSAWHCLSSDIKTDALVVAYGHLKRLQRQGATVERQSGIVGLADLVLGPARGR